LTHCGRGKYNAQIKKAFASGAGCALILEGETTQEQVKIKVLADGGETHQMDVQDVPAWCGNFFQMTTE
jgi:hypothetical protein